MDTSPGSSYNNVNVIMWELLYIIRLYYKRTFNIIDEFSAIFLQTVLFKIELFLAALNINRNTKADFVHVLVNAERDGNGLFWFRLHVKYSLLLFVMLNL